MADQIFFSSLGARTLKEEEIKLSLPTYSKLKDQIETIRKNAIAYRKDKKGNTNSENAFTRPQVTNNLSILGPRGSGKSSILKTLYEDLSQQNDVKNFKNILLPPIVPENLENHMTLMSSLLGLLNGLVMQVKDLDKQKTHSSPFCPPKEDSLERNYQQLVEYYVHVQKPYQDISIQKYSTESDYVRTMSEVFEAGNQFSLKLWDFIDQLLEHYKTEGVLLFVFIDDIDLSTYRCMDVVRTLLGYISHPSIVTVLAGDIEVFGEALTLDFLRQENMLGESDIMVNYTISQVQDEDGTKMLLNRKKDLAYEYLKKVMPPMNRHSISIWNLNNRGQFCPVGLYQNDGNIPTLQELLAETNQFNSLLESYFSEPKTQDSNQSPNENFEQASVKDDKVLYHLFDFTARSLINCYIPIEQMVRQWEKSEESEFKNVKFTLESIVFSNSHLNAIRNEIFPHFLQFGAEESSTYIYFNNFNNWVNEQIPYLTQYELFKGNASNITESNNLEVLVFQVFVYLDWAARLLNKESVLKTQDYEIAKKTALFLLCVNGAISEKNEKLSSGYRADLYKLAFNTDKSLAYSDCEPKIVFLIFFGLSFPLAVRYYQSFNISQMIEIVSKGHIPANIDMKLLELQYAYDFIRLVINFYNKKDSKKKRIICLSEQPEMLNFIDRQIKGRKSNTLIFLICNNYLNKNLRLYNLYHGNDTKTEGKQQYYPEHMKEPQLANLWEYVKTSSKPKGNNEWEYKNIFTKESEKSSTDIPIYNYYSKLFWDKITDEHEHKYVKLLRDTYTDISAQATQLSNNNSNEKEVMEQRLKVLFSIDSNGLWLHEGDVEEDESPTKQIKIYILKKIESCEKELFPDQGECSIDFSGASTAFKEFQNIYMGKKDTLAQRCEKLLEPYKELNSITRVEYIYVRIVLNRLINSTAWYGRQEARKILSALDQATLLLPINKDNDSNILENYIFWFHCFCRYRMAELSDKTYRLVDEIYKNMEIIREAQYLLDQRQMNDYNRTMREQGHLEDELIQKIPELF